MKNPLSRRKFFGAAAAAAAAPILTDKIQENGGANMSSYPSFGNTTQYQVDPLWESTRKSTLEKLARGEFTEEQLQQIGSYGTTENVEFLRSVSPAAKQFIYQRMNTENAKQSYIRRAKEYLKQQIWGNKPETAEEFFKKWLP